MNFVRIRYDSYTNQTICADDDDGEPYSYRGETDTNHIIHGIDVVKKGVWHDVVTDFKVEVAKPYYLLYVTYTTGDSFGSDGGNIEFIGLYTNREIADENAARIEKHQVKSDNGYYADFQLMLVAESDPVKEYVFYAPWNGYFERLENVEIEKIYTM